MILKRQNPVIVYILPQVTVFSHVLLPAPAEVGIVIHFK